MRDYKQIAYIAVTTGTLLISNVAQAVDLTTSSSQPVLFFDDTDSLGTEWFVGGYEEKFIVHDFSSGAEVFRIIPGSNDSNEDSLVVDSNGDVGVANSTLIIDRSTKSIGIGTTPESPRDLHVGGNGNMTLQFGSQAKWDIFTISDGSIYFQDALNGDKRPLRINADSPTDSVRITANGVGMGTNTPAAKLDVAGDINATFDGSSATNLQQLFVMSANNTDSGKKSDAGFVVENARENFAYAFRTLENFTPPGTSTEKDGGFAISKQATGAQELVLINPTTNDPTAVELYLSSGASNVNGQWVNASSRSYKKNIHDLSGDDAMQAMRELKSVTYEFKQDKDQEKMIGFIAEDVPELLATKTRKTVDPLRIVAVLTKAMQEQDKVLVSKDREIAEMRNKAEKNTSRLEKLEDQLKKLLMK